MRSWFRVGLLTGFLLMGIHAKGTAQQPAYRVKEIAGVEKIRLLPPGPGNPRNSEGDFLELKDGRVLFIYSHFTGGGSDHAAAHLAARYSDDGGKTWSDKDAVIVEREGDFNVMSVSLLQTSKRRCRVCFISAKTR